MIVNTHGVRGEVKIEPWTDSPEFLLRFKVIYIDGKAVEVLNSRAHNGFVIAKLQGVEEVRDAMSLKGRVISIDRDDAKLPEGEYFIADIIGAKVVDEDGVLLGELEEVLERPAGKIYVVRGEREILIPAVPEFLLKTDVSAGVITVRLIEGL